MSDRFSADITIGGAVPRSLVAALCEAISDSGAGLDWEGGCDPGCAEDLLHLAEAEGARGTIRLHDCQASYGEFPELEAFLIANGIAFDRASEAKYEYDGEVLKFRPGHEPYHLLATQDGGSGTAPGKSRASWRGSMGSRECARMSCWRWRRRCVTTCEACWRWTFRPCRRSPSRRDRCARSPCSSVGTL